MKWRVRYSGPSEVEVEADDEFEAEQLASDLMLRDCRYLDLVGRVVQRWGNRTNPAKTTNRASPSTASQDYIDAH